MSNLLSLLWEAHRCDDCQEVIVCQHKDLDKKLDGHYLDSDHDLPNFTKLHTEVCHCCGHHLHDSDHCPVCYCEQHEAYCDGKVDHAACPCCGDAYGEEAAERDAEISQMEYMEWRGEQAMENSFY